MRQHYIVCGYGRIGHRISEVLKDANIPIVVIENKSSSIERLKDANLLYVQGDAQDEDVLKRAGIAKLRKDGCNDFRSLAERVSKHDFLNQINPQSLS